jgi:hypothetical protein
MARAIALCALVVIAGSGPRAQENGRGWFDLPVPGGLATLEALEIAEGERAFTLPILARALTDRDSRGGFKAARAAAALAAAPVNATSDDHAIVIPAPLDAKTWLQLLPPADQRDLFTRMVSDRNALLLAASLLSTDPSIRALLARDRDLLRFIYQQATGGFALAARRLRLVDGRLTLPGGEHAEAVWRGLVGEPASRPGPFLRALLTKDEGRLAWYFDTISGLDPDHLASAWREPEARNEAAALYLTFRGTDSQWRAQNHPFRRGVADAWTLVTQIDVEGGYAVSSLPQEVWALLFSTARPTQEQLERVLRERHSRVSVSWLAHEIVGAPARERRQRYEIFRLAQRVLPGTAAADLAAFAVAFTGIRDCRALLFALERMQIRSAATWAAAVAAARHVSDESDDRRESLASFQGALALLERLRHVRTIDAATADHLVRSLSDAVREDNHVTRSLARWIPDTLARALPPLVRPDAFTGKTAYESTIIQALAGPRQMSDTAPRLRWEGLTYTVDIVAAEHDRLKAMRLLLPPPGLDDAIGTGRPRELAAALTSLVYATALGDPEGPASLSPDVVTRHDFGLGGTSLVREELPWSPPEERQGFGPWRVAGSLLGLDLGLSRMAMRRISAEQMPTAPTLTLNDLGTLTRTAVALIPAEMTDAERHELASAIARGRARVRDAIAEGSAALDALAREARTSETTRQLLPWMVSRQRDGLSDVFSLRELLSLGQPKMTGQQLDRWGVAADGLDGRRITAMPPPAPWEDYAGRSEAGQVTTQAPDLTLRLVEETARLDVPAVLIPALLGFALQDYWHDVQARFADDWPQLTRQAARLESARIQDYVAALTGNGPLRAQ